MTDQPRFAGQQFPQTPQRTQVLQQPGWQPQQPAHWQAQQQWPNQQWPQQAPLAQQGWPQPAADPSQPSTEEKNAAFGAYLGALFMPILLPLLIMLIANNKPFQRAAGLQALITQLGCMAISMLCPILMMVLLFSTRPGSGSFYLGYVPMLMCWAFSFGFALMGVAESQKGKIQYAPLIGRRLAKTFRAEWPAG